MQNNIKNFVTKYLHRKSTSVMLNILMKETIQEKGSDIGHMEYAVMLSMFLIGNSLDDISFKNTSYVRF